jgi:SPP1 family predicted phage head-tail adaptor
MPTPFQKFDQRATIVSYAETADGYGGLGTPTETTVSTEWVAVKFQAGMEIFEAGKVVGTADYLITMWYNASVTKKMSVKIGTRVFDIAAVDNFEMKNEYLNLYCNEVV